MTRRTGVWLIAGLVVTAGAIGVGLAVGRGQAAPETRCIDTWNNPHSGGQALDGLYSPSLTAFSGGEELGFVSRRASVVADHWDCSIRFEVGGGWTYTFADVRDNESPVIVGWSGSGSPQPPQIDHPLDWNACQRDDGTLSLGPDSCPPHNPRVKPRAIIKELEYRVVQAMLGNAQDHRYYPFWLGLRFRGAIAGTTATSDRLDVSYSLRYAGRAFGVYVWTYHPRLGAAPDCPFENSTCKTVLIRRDSPGATVIVGYNELVGIGEVGIPFPAAVRQQISDELTQTTQFELLSVHPPTTGPTSTATAPTQVDTHQHRRWLWLGEALLGLHASIVRDSPAGVGVVRYGSPDAGNRYYIVTYKPVEGICGELGCPPPVPSELLGYGTTLQTWLLARGWLSVILAPHPAEVRLPARVGSMTPTTAR